MNRGDLVANSAGTLLILVSEKHCGDADCLGEVQARLVQTPAGSHPMCYRRRDLTVVAPSANLVAEPAKFDTMQQDDDLDEILGDAMVGDEYEDGDGYSRQGLRRVDDTDIPEKLIAWRDAAVKAALEAASK